MSGVESCRDQGEQKKLPVRPRKNGVAAKNRHRWSAERRAGRVNGR